MLPLNPKLNYEPSEEIIGLWPKTFTRSSNYQGVILPGLFSTSLFSFHALCFVAILFGEFYGWFKIRELSTGQINQVFLGLILLDFVLVSIAYFIVGKIKVVKNRLVLENDTFAIMKLNRSIFFPKLLLTFLKALLIAIAFFKIYSYFDLTGTSFNRLLKNADVIPVIGIYILVAILHIFTTTYFIAYVVLHIRVKMEENRIGNNIVTHRTSYFKKSIDFKEGKVRSGDNHHFLTKKVIDTSNNKELIEDVNPETKDCFKLHSWGVLTDKALDDLIWIQYDADKKRELAVGGLKHQLELL